MAVHQGKVCMVMPCYNKENYISAMFDTIIAQTWDNIALVLVNDGSTDKTMDIILNYVPKFKERGYEAVAVDQENSGVIAAANAGLKVALADESVDYVCLVDSDDELDPEYVRTQAGYLDVHEDTDFTIVGMYRFEDTATGRKETVWPEVRPLADDDEIGPEHLFMTETINPTVYIYMARADYIKKCCIVQTWETGLKAGCHEPGYIIPLLANYGHRKFINAPLYKARVLGESYSRSDNMEHYRNYYSIYNELAKRAIDALPSSVATPEKKHFWMNCCHLASAYRLYRIAVRLDKTSSDVQTFAENMLDVVNAAFQISAPITKDKIGIPSVDFTYIIEAAVFERNTQVGKDAYPELLRERL